MQNSHIYNLLLSIRAIKYRKFHTSKEEVGIFTKQVKGKYVFTKCSTRVFCKQHFFSTQTQCCLIFS